VNFHIFALILDLLHAHVLARYYAHGVLDPFKVLLWLSTDKALQCLQIVLLWEDHRAIVSHLIACFSVCSLHYDDEVFSRRNSQVHNELLVLLINRPNDLRTGVAILK
jgi:hypothetical protein